MKPGMWLPLKWTVKMTIIKRGSFLYSQVDYTFAAHLTYAGIPLPILPEVENAIREPFIIFLVWTLSRILNVY